MSDVNELVRTAEMFPPASAGEVIVEREYVDDEDPTVTGPWSIETVAAADWAVTRYAALRQQQADIDAQLEAAIERLTKRAEKLKSNLERGIAYFGTKLAEYANSHRKELLGGGKKKSREFLSGTIGWRKRGGGLKVVDKAALVAWLEAQPPELGLYRIKIEPEMKALQEQFKATGEVPPGMDWDPEDEVFFVKPAETAIEVSK